MRVRALTKSIWERFLDDRMENLLFNILEDFNNRQLDSIWLAARFSFLQILFGETDRAFIGARTVNVGGIGSILHQISDDLDEQLLLHLDHVGILLASKVHQYGATMRELVDIRPMLQKDVCHPQRERLVLIIILVLVESTEAIDQWGLLHTVLLVHIRTLLGQHADYFIVSSHACGRQGCILRVFGRQIHVEARIML